jgi:broad specificity phosphatase PhoE
MIILIRHAQSEGNKNRSIHQTVPDHRVKLTPDGQQQALAAGRKLRSLLHPDDTLHFFTSPYRRTRETTEGILASLTSDDPSPSPFPRHTIKVYEEPRLREQDFGNFQPCSAEMERMWQERADYGHFFYRIPNGESAADAYDRVSGFNESLWRLFGEEDFASVCILVTHGLMTRVFLMKWYHFSVEYFEDLRNVNHCEFVVMKKNQGNGRYILQNQLRTWSELRRERQQSLSLSKSQTQLNTAALSSSPIPVRKKWGGCPEGCTHGQMKQLEKTPQRKNTVDLFKDDDELDPLSQPTQQKGLGIVGATSKTTAQGNPIRDTYPPQEEDEHTPHEDKDQGQSGIRTTELSLPSYLQTEGIVSSAAGTPPHINMSPSQPEQGSLLSPRAFDILTIGRDGGGSRSGAASPLTSDGDEELAEEADEAMPLPSDPPKSDCKDGAAPPANRRAWGSLAKALNGGFMADGGEREGMSHGAMADALGDQSDVGSDGGELHDELLLEEEEADKSLRGSVY